MIRRSDAPTDFEASSPSSNRRQTGWFHEQRPTPMHPGQDRGRANGSTRGRAMLELFVKEGDHPDFDIEFGTADEVVQLELVAQAPENNLGGQTGVASVEVLRFGEEQIGGEGSIVNAQKDVEGDGSGGTNPGHLVKTRGGPRPPRNCLIRLGR